MLGAINSIYAAICCENRVFKNANSRDLFISRFATWVPLDWPVSLPGVRNGPSEATPVVPWSHTNCYPWGASDLTQIVYSLAGQVRVPLWRCSKKNLHHEEQGVLVVVFPQVCVAWWIDASSHVCLLSVFLHIQHIGWNQSSTCGTKQQDFFWLLVWNLIGEYLLHVFISLCTFKTLIAIALGCKVFHQNY